MSKEHQPLEALKFPYYNQAKGAIEQLNALDPKFCQDVGFPEYQPAPKISPETNPSVWENWIESLAMIEKNFIWLLKLPHTKFWCQIVNNGSLQACLDSYLKKTPRFQTASWPDEVLEKHNSVHKLVFMAYMRIATFKETSSCFISPEFFGELIYENFLFDLPKIMDLCSVYGNKTNAELLGKAISNVFKNQPAYNYDLKQSVETIMEIFHNIDDKCGVENTKDGQDTSTTRRPHRLSEGSQKNFALLDISFDEFKDITTYVSDISHTLCRFLVDIYPEAGCEFYKKNIIPYLARFYSSTLVKLNEAVQDRCIDDLHVRSQLLAHLRIARKSLLSVARGIINHSLLQPALRAADAGDHARSMSIADEYFQILSELLGESRFFSDFLRKLPIINDVQSLLQASPGIDETRASFILGSLGNGTNRKPERKRSPVINGANLQLQEKGGDVFHGIKPAGAQEEMAVMNAAADAEIESLISSVQDVLPNLGEGFIESCLLYYEKDYEKTIHALLEENLPDDLRIMDKSTPRRQRGSLVESSEAINTGRRHDATVVDLAVLPERKNVFDNDEFESANVDHSRIHRGKKDKTLRDDGPTPEMRAIKEKYSIVCDEVDVSDDGNIFHDEGGFSCVYDDEYDDVYDDLGVDANDADDADDLLNRRPFVTPRVFLQQKKEKSYQEDSDNEEDESEKPDHFVANPAELRAKQEEKRKHQQDLRDSRKNTTRQQRSAEKPNATKDRKKKDINKARVANHNRKKMSSKKASKGMGPV